MNNNLFVLNNELHGKMTPLFIEIRNKPWTNDLNDDIPIFLLGTYFAYALALVWNLTERHVELTTTILKNEK